MNTPLQILFVLFVATISTTTCRLLSDKLISTQSNNTLTVYTNPTVFGQTASTGDTFDVFGTFAGISGLNSSTLHVIRVPSGEIISRSLNYTEYNYTYAPDVAISFDSQQAALYNDTIFTSFVLENNQSLSIQLQQLANITASRAVPYQYNIISMLYNSDKLPYLNQTYNSTVNGTSNYTLESAYGGGNNISISNYTLINPTIDDTGLGFLLWTIAEYGDPLYNITGIQSQIGDWRYWWLRAFQQNVTIMDTWTAAFDALYDPVTDVGIMSSYGLDPAYNVCQNYTNNLLPLITNVNNSKYAWGEIIEMGVLATSQHMNLSEQLVNYIFSDEQVQNQTIYQDWSMPANTNVTIPQCYLNSGSILPDQVNLYNIPLRNQTNLFTTLPIWLNEWTQMFNRTYNGTYYIGHNNYTYTYSLNNTVHIS